MKTKHLLISILIFSTTLLVACGGGSSEPNAVSGLPTRFELPTETPSPIAAVELFSPTPEVISTLPATDIATDELAPTFTVTPSLTITDTPTRTLTATATEPFVPNVLDFLAEVARTTTLVPQTFYDNAQNSGLATLPAPIGQATSALGSGSCSTPPTGGFATIYFNNTNIPAELGCPLVNTLATNQPAAYQRFERGWMIWMQGAPNIIVVLYDTGIYERYIDTWVSGESIPVGEQPPAGLIEPVRGFGKVWRENMTVKTGLGWASTAESSTIATLQDFERGSMLNVMQRGDTLILLNTSSTSSGTWRAFPGNY